MGDEGQAGAGAVAGETGQLLGHLRLVAVAVQAVGGDALVGLGVVIGETQGAPRPRDARLGVHHYVRLDDAGAQGGRQGQHGARGVAAGVGYHPGRPHRLPVQLRQAVGGPLQQLRRRVLDAIPAGVFLGVAQAEVGRQVYDRQAGPDVGQEGLGAGGVGQGGEDHLHPVVQLLLHRQVVAGEMGEDLGEGPAGAGAPRHRHHPRLRVQMQEAGQFRPGIARDAQDAHLHHGCATSSKKDEAPPLAVGPQSRLARYCWDRRRAKAPRRRVGRVVAGGERRLPCPSQAKA